VVSASTGGPAAQPEGGLHAADRGHPDIHQHHVRRQGVHRGAHLGAVGALAHHVEAELGTQDAAEPGPDQFLVIDEEHPDHHAGTASPGPSGSVAATSQP
jgi:sarcosine oxidase gamma subunit